MSELTHKETGSPLNRVLRQRNFRLLWLGEGISLLGDQFYLIALPWLVLTMKGDALAVGGVLAVAGIPRALFMLIGGAVIDRFSPRTVMLGSNLVRMAVVALLAVLVFTGLIRIWGVYVIALLFGVVDAFFFPAQSAIVPEIVEKEHLQIGNSIIHGTAQLSRFAGPVLAGVVIAFLGGAEGAYKAGGQQSPDMGGIAYAFGFDALTFLVSAITLHKMGMPKSGSESAQDHQRESVWADIRAGLLSVWRAAGLRTLFLLVMAINLLVNGPILVGVPVLAGGQFSGGATAFGVLMSAYGGGNLLGVVLAGSMPRPSAKSMGAVLLATMGVLGCGVALLGFISTVPFAVGILLVMGTANGYVSILFVTWLQSQIPQFMLGRLMSLLMFAAMGLNPISMALSGFFMKLYPSWTFGLAGAMMLTIVLLSALNPRVRNMGIGLSGIG